MAVLRENWLCFFGYQPRGPLASGRLCGERKRSFMPSLILSLSKDGFVSQNPFAPFVMPGRDPGAHAGART